MEEIKVSVIGQMEGTFESTNRIYDTEGLAPTLNTCQGGGLQPKIIVQTPITTNGKVSEIANTILAGYERSNMTGFNNDNAVCVGIRQATQKGYIEMELGGVADLSYPDSDKRRGRVQGGGQICPTITASDPNICRIEKKHQQDDFNLETGLSRTLVAGSHGNADTYTKTVVSTSDPTLLGGLGEKNSNNGTQYFQHDRVYASDGIAMSHCAQLAGGSYKYMTEEKQKYRIRKLTPKECFRLMGVKDEDYEKLTVSNSQKYKQAGNSIVVDVLEAIFNNMFVNECKSTSLF